MTATLLHLAALFATLSLLAVGGGNGIIPAMQHATVAVHHWMTARQFLDIFAISRATPGPGSLVVVLVGLKAAGLPGAMVAALAMFTPSCLLVHFAARVWHHYRASSWRSLVERALGPVAIGLTYAGGIALLRETERSPIAWAVTAAATLTLATTRLSPLPVLLAGGVIGFVLLN